MRHQEHVPLERSSKIVGRAKGTISDAPEICAFTMEPCLLGDGLLRDDDVCPFTLESVCICSRPFFAGWN